MSLVAGQKLGSYEIIAPIGKGGMGEVYKARDTKLDRDVAIKVLPEEFAENVERLARFEREAKLLASLNHPNIASIYGFESGALVLELVDGPTLAERIEHAPITIDEAIAIAKQIAEALEAGHEAGVIHRDLKPANIKLKEDGTVKVLDYGLAKALEGETPSKTDSHLSQSPTLTRQGTQIGVILGTAAYMSPETAKGKRVDKRTDIWAFGAVVYELLTGRRVFSGDDVSDTLAAILKEEPDWAQLPADTPSKLQEVLRRCLRKDPARRLRDIGDARIELEDAVDAPVVETVHRMRGGALVLAAAASLVSGLGVWLLTPTGRDVAPRAVTRTAIPLPAGSTLGFGLAPMVALSPDGRTAAFVAAQDGVEQLYLRSLDALEARLVPGTEGAVGLFFSPDGRWVGFSREGISLEKVSVTGGAPIAITAESARMATWAPDGTIVFTRDRRGLDRVPSDGGPTETLTTPDRERREKTHRLPNVLPGGQAILYTDGSADIESFDDASIAVLDLATGKSRILIQGGSNPLYVSSGHLVYARAGEILAVPFDAAALEVNDPPVTVVEGVFMVPISGGAYFSVSAAGDLLYAPRDVPGAPDARIVWIDRDGKTEPLTESKGNYFDARLSPDENWLAINLAAANNSIWLYDRARATMTRLVAGFENMAPVWGPLGNRLAFASSRSGALRLHWVGLDGSAAPELLLPGDEWHWPTSWSSDGRWLAYDEEDEDIWVLPMEGERTPRPVARTPASERSLRFAPSSRFVAYVSDETGRDEIYVQSFPESNIKKTVSTGGGDWPLWSADGRELFYRVANEVWVAAVETSHGLTLGVPRALFAVTANHEGPFDVSADGERFVFIDRSDVPPLPTHLILVQNWGDELKRLVPTGDE